ncbi:MAG: beta-ketoacyl synthase chain length factor [Thermoanaerobaculia bacterium]|nr:beta-ketoacyl synthase chain length factor [Thermoanaerobaculia bacterium]
MTPFVCADGVRVALSGVGAIGAWGVGAAALGASWRAGGPPPVEVDRGAGYHRPGSARLARLTGAPDLSAYLAPAQARRMSPPARLAVAAARLALADAGLADLAPAQHAHTALVAGTAFGPASVTEQLLTQIFGQGPEAASPALFTESVASATASQVALAIGARGPNVAVTGREASDLLAWIAGARLIAAGAAERVLVIVVDEMTPLLHAVLDRCRALARPEADGREVARPFDRRRRGAVGADGAAVFVLERASEVAARGGRPLATLAAWARAFDVTAPAWQWGSGDAALAATLSAALARGGVTAASIDGVISGASGARRGDALEAGVLRALFGDGLPPVVAPKGALGGWGGGFAAAAALVAGGRAAGPTAGFEALDPACGIAPGAAPERPPARALVSSLASGGAAAWVVLDGGQPGSAAAV